MIGVSSIVRCILKRKVVGLFPQLICQISACPAMELGNSPPSAVVGGDGSSRKMQFWTHTGRFIIRVNKKMCRPLIMMH